MKTTSKLVIFVFALFALAASAYAQSPLEQLNQMVEQLQSTPDDAALRERIIKLAPTLTPSPVLPDTAISFEGRAQFAFRSATSEDDFLVAAQEYEKAVAVAPWVPGYYADLCTIYEKAGKFEDAKRHCEFYLIGLINPAQMTDVKRRIAGLEFGIEKANSPQARDAELLQKFVGDWQGVPMRSGAGTNYVVWLHVTHQSGDNWSISFSTDVEGVHASEEFPHGASDIRVVQSELQFAWEGAHFNNRGCATHEVRGVVSADGSRLSLAYTLMPFPPNRSLECPLEEFFYSFVDEYTKLQ